MWTCTTNRVVTVAHLRGPSPQRSLFLEHLEDLLAPGSLVPPEDQDQGTWPRYKQSSSYIMSNTFQLSTQIKPQLNVTIHTVVCFCDWVRRRRDV